MSSGNSNLIFLAIRQNLLVIYGLLSYSMPTTTKRSDSVSVVNQLLFLSFTQKPL